MEDKKLNIVVIDESYNTEEKIVSLIRSMELAAHSKRAEDEEDLSEILKDVTPDLVIYTTGMELITLRQTCECLTKHFASRPIPVIAMKSKEGEETTVEMIADGAVDLVAYDQPEHLKQVIRREISALENWKRMITAESAYDESEKRCNTLLDSSRDAIAYVHEGMHIYSNQSYMELFDIEAADDLEGMPVLDMVAVEDRDKFKTFLREYQKHEVSDQQLDIKLKKQEGEEFEGKMEFSPASISGERCIQIIIRNQMDSAELERQIKLLAQMDQLTGLFNRQHFIDTLNKVVNLSKEKSLKASLLMVQIDDYDSIRNRIGVAGGDQCVANVAEVITRVVSKGDVLSRYLLSTYTVIARDLEMDDVQEYADRIRSAVEDHSSDINGVVINTTCSVSISMIDKDAPDSNEILARAEKAMAKSHESGINRTEIYIPKKGELTQQEEDSQIVNQLKNSLKNDRFLLYYQPIISMHGDSEQRYEICIRMMEADGNDIVLPEDFLPAAERTDMMLAIDRWVINKAINVLAEKRKNGHPVQFFIKLSSSSVKDDSLPLWIKERMSDAELPKGCLIFEVPETIAVTHLKFAKSLADELHKINCGFTLDDFGTGTNPFQLLKHIDVDYLKIEASFMENLPSNSQNQETVKKISESASELGKLTIAQSVQDANSLSVLWGMGVTFTQGYFLQEPSPDLDYDFSAMAG